VTSDEKTSPLLQIVTFVVGVLIDAGAGVNEADFEGNYPLHYAVKTGRVELVKTIIDAGADVGVKNKAGRNVRDGCGDTAILALLDSASSAKNHPIVPVAVVAVEEEVVTKDDRRRSSLPLESRDIEAQTDDDGLAIENASLKETNSTLLKKVESLDAQLVERNECADQLSSQLKNLEMMMKESKNDEKAVADRAALDSIVDMQAKRIKDLEIKLSAAKKVKSAVSTRFADAPIALDEDDEDNRPFVSCVYQPAPVTPVSAAADLQLRLSILRSSQKEISDNLVDTNETINRISVWKESLETGKRIWFIFLYFR
jgi:hypothetical protein